MALAGLANALSYERGKCWLCYYHRGAWLPFELGSTIVQAWLQTKSDFVTVMLPFGSFLTKSSSLSPPFTVFVARAEATEYVVRGMLVVAGLCILFRMLRSELWPIFVLEYSSFSYAWGPCDFPMDLALR